MEALQMKLKLCYAETATLMNNIKKLDVEIY
jgi:hypothetical protein